MSASKMICIHVVGLTAIAALCAYLALPEKKKDEVKDKVKNMKKQEIKMIEDALN